MKKVMVYCAILGIIATIIFPTIVQAQEAPHVFDSTIPVDGGIINSLNSWLAISSPSTATYYAVTYYEPIGLEYAFVSLAGLNIISPSDAWSITEDENGFSQVIWLGTVRLFADGSVELLTRPQASLTSRMAVPNPIPLLNGGGTYVRFPWQSGKSVMYGPRGVHSAGYSQNEMVAVDLVSGSDMGAGAANANVYASTSGEIDYICEDDTTVAIRTSNDNYDYFIYAHLLDNANLEMEHEFAAGALIGAVKSGTFDDDCGWADQNENHYHLHWGFKPANNTYRVGNCVLSTTTQTFTCGTKKIQPTQYLTWLNSMPNGLDDPSSLGGGPTFFDYLLVGFVGIFDRGIVKLLPDHTSPTLLPRVLLNTIRFTLRVDYALLMTNFNAGPAMAALFATLGFRAALGVSWLIMLFWRIFKTNIPFI